MSGGLIIAMKSDPERVRTILESDGHTVTRAESASSGMELLPRIGRSCFDHRYPYAGP